MTIAKIKEIQADIGGFRTPAYFQQVPNTLYGKKVIYFEVKTALDVLDLGKKDTVTNLISKMEEQGASDAKVALLAKLDPTFDEADTIISLGAPKTEGTTDKTLHAWFEKNGIAGWRIPFPKADEIMLTSVGSLECKGKYSF